MSPAPDVPLMLVTTAEGHNLESEEAINNGSSGINEQNTSNEYEEDQQYNKPIFIHGTLVACWMDNRMVFCVSTVHRIGQTIKRCIRKPRVTPKNKAHVDKVWGDKGKMHIEIPRLIDDYNHWMGGVDLSDQHISYYHPNLRCRRNWIPIFPR